MASKRKSSGKSRARSRVDALPGARGGGAKARVLRIIGGRHRGRRLRFPADVEIRPTPDRVRETLFNWLRDRVVGARVLDLFAGSGALGLEALSRGAASVTFIEQDRRAASAIETLTAEWQESAAAVVCADALGWLAGPYATKAAFDIVFLDPPFDTPLLRQAVIALATPGLLAADARVYIERRARDQLPELPPGWQNLREGRAGEVGYHLFAS